MLPTLSFLHCIDHLAANAVRRPAYSLGVDASGGDQLHVEAPATSRGTPLRRLRRGVRNDLLLRQRNIVRELTKSLRRGPRRHPPLQDFLLDSHRPRSSLRVRPQGKRRAPSLMAPHASLRYHSRNLPRPSQLRRRRVMAPGCCRQCQNPQHPPRQFPATLSTSRRPFQPCTKCSGLGLASVSLAVTIPPDSPQFLQNIILAPHLQWNPRKVTRMPRLHTNNPSSAYYTKRPLLLAPGLNFSSNSLKFPPAPPIRQQ